MIRYKFVKEDKNWVAYEVQSNNVVAITTTKLEAEFRCIRLRKSFDGFTPEFLLRSVTC